MKRETTTQKLLHYLSGGALISLLSGALPGVLPILIYGWTTHTNPFTNHPFLLSVLALSISTLLFAFLAWRDEEGRHIKKAKITGRSVHANVRGWAIKFHPDGTRETIGRYAGY